MKRERERERGGKLELHASPSTGEITDSASKNTPLFLTDTCPVLDFLLFRLFSGGILSVPYSFEQFVELMN